VLTIAATAQTPGASVDLGAIDKSVNPCTNFYLYACGNWIKNNPMPSDQSRWGRFNELARQNQEIERKILEQAATPSSSRNALQQKIGDYYSSCMDEKTIDQKGVAPLKPLLDSVDALKSRDQLNEEIVRLHRDGVRVFFSLRVQPDEKNAEKNLASISQGGLSMLDRDYYLKDDPPTAAIRKQFLEHVRKMFELLDQGLGRSTADAARQAGAVLAIETTLAKNSLDRVALRNPDNTYHLMTVQQLAELTPDFHWREFLNKVGLPPVTSLNVAEPEFVRGLAPILSGASLDDLKTYMAWHVLNDSVNLFDRRAPLDANVLPKAFEEENWNFNSHILNGTPEQEPRWKRCVQSADRLLGEALGQEFVKVAFSAQSKEKTLEMVSEIEAEMAKVIKAAEWMSPATKDQALTKLQLVANKIGYPDKWETYRSVKIVPGDAFGNNERASQAAIQENLKRVGKPVDKSKWSMTPPTVNAYYNPPENNINFPAGILQTPFYNPKASDPTNYGGIGGVIGHELTHGFDDQGRRYDGRGNLRDWWTEADGKAFDKRADCIVQEYGGFSPVAGVHLNGKLTLGENAADNGGLRLAFMAMMDRMAGHPMETIAGYTPQQQFFLGFAQLWCGMATPESAAVRVKTDPHSPGEFRVNGTLQNMPEFSSAFSCKVGDSMVSDKACRIW
jgi:endothelin-converting enzyme/putative endopeptidase